MNMKAVSEKGQSYGWREVQVDVGHSTYPIIIGENLLKEAGKQLKKILPQARALVVTDSAVAPLYLATLLDSLRTAGIAAEAVVLRSGESTKSGASLIELLETLLSYRPERKTALIALGGGVIGDITGFAASILLRGVPFVQIPTTLLAQVDSSVGGKTAINSTHGKNLIGSFYQPLAVLSDTGTLETLPKRELLAGYAEVLKYGLIGDADFFGWLETTGADVLRGEPRSRAYAIEVSCRSKAVIVGADEKESGQRALLNFGHTFGHTLEKFTGYSDKLLHGEAVALGMLMASYASMQKGWLPKADYERILQHYRQVGLPTRLSDFVSGADVKKLLSYLHQDKKVEEGAVRFILLKGLGNAIVTTDLTLAEAEAAFNAFL